MSENQNINIATASGVLAGGAIGGYLGAKNAPSVIGRINIDNVLEHTPYSDVVRDKFYNIREATGDCFTQARAIFLNAEHGPKGDAKMMFNTLGNPETITVKELKETIANGEIYSCKMNAKEQLGNYSKMFEKLGDDTKFNVDELAQALKKEHSIYKDAKQRIEDLINALPKQKGKYGAICAIAGGLTVGLCAYIASSLNEKIKK